ncbi:hypothetical protein J4Q44_G00075220 [Coregonus suidteri]|uniref:Uncharacterized protein n=1 Tax=Coregonus suidteri TaxID=861788 RepID=A0AAN8QZU7_9TELE
MVSKETNHLVTGQHTNSKTADNLPGAMTVRSVLLNRDSPDIESRLKRRRNRTHQVRFKDLEDGLGGGTTGAKSYQRTAAERDSPHPFRKNSPTSPMAPQGWLTEASVVGAVRGDMADTIEVVAAFLARAPPHPLTPGPVRRCWAPPPSPPRPCSLTLPLSRRQCTSMAIQTSPLLQKPKPSVLSKVCSVGDSVGVDGDNKQDNEHDEYYTTHNYLSEPASRDGNGPGSKAKQGLVDQTQCLRTTEANANSPAVGNHMDSSWHNSSCSSPPKHQGSATPSQVRRRRRRINRAISDPGREVSYCTTPMQTDSPCVSPPNTPPPSTVQPCTSPPPSTAQHCSTQYRRVIEWECRGERRILPPPPPPPPPYTPRKEGVNCTSGSAHRAPLLRRASEKEKSGKSRSPVHCPRASSLKHRAQTPLEVPLKGNQGDQGSSPTKAIPRPTCLGQAQAQLGAQLGALHKMLCSGPNTPNSQHALPPGQCPSGARGCSGSGGGSTARPLTSTQADTLRQVQEILGGLVSGARSKLDPTWVAEKLMGPNGPLHDIRSLQTQLHSLEGVLETSQNTIKVLLDVIQDLEKKEAEREGRHSYRTGQDIENCGTCRDCACIIYSVEHDFRLQEGAVTRTWRVEDRPEGSPLAAVTPQPTTPHRQESPLLVTPARPPHSGKKSRKKCFWFL